MIIKYPTALYSTVIPSEPETPGNVTYTISNTVPPRASKTTIIIPPAIELKSWPEIIIDQSQRRKFLGAQIFTVARSSLYSSMSGMKQHEVGEVLEFVDEVDSGLQPMVIAPDTEIRHDTNRLDYIGIGLSEDDIEAIDEASSIAYLATITELNKIRSDRATIEAALNNNQKQQNEVTKVLSAIGSIDGNQMLSDIKTKLENKLAELDEQESQLIVEANSLAGEAIVVSDKLRNISQVVR